MLNGLTKPVFTPEKLATLKATDKRKTGLKSLDQTKCSIIRGLLSLIGVIICTETVRKRLANIVKPVYNNHLGGEVSVVITDRWSL